MRKAVALFVVWFAALAATSCGDVVRQGRSPVYLIVDKLEAARGSDPEKFVNPLISDVITNVTSPEPCKPDSPCPTIFNDLGRVQLRLGLRDLGTATSPTTVTTNNEVTITRYHVAYRRTDGRKTEGVDVPYAFDGAVTSTVCGCSSGTILAFEIVRHDAKMESPLVQLKTNPGILNAIADVTFYGRDQVGNDVSVTGSILVDFGNFGDI